MIKSHIKRRLEEEYRYEKQHWERKVIERSTVLGREKEARRGGRGKIQCGES